MCVLQDILLRADVIPIRYHDWAVGLNNAGRKTEVAIQFCMAMPSDIMLSVHLDWVTNARASDDYAGGVDNLINVPHASLLMWSLGMRPRCAKLAIDTQSTLFLHHRKITPRVLRSHIPFVHYC